MGWLLRAVVLFRPLWCRGRGRRGCCELCRSAARPRRGILSPDRLCPGYGGGWCGRSQGRPRRRGGARWRQRLHPRGVEARAGAQEGGGEEGGGVVQVGQNHGPVYGVVVAGPVGAKWWAGLLLLCRLLLLRPRWGLRAGI